MCPFYLQMRFIGLLFTAYPKGCCWFVLHLQSRGRNRVAWQILQKGEREGSMRAVLLLGGVRRDPCWDAVILCVPKPVLGLSTSIDFDLLTSLEVQPILSVVSVLVKSYTSGSHNRKLFFQIKKKKIPCLASLFPPPSTWPSVWLAWAPSQRYSLGELGAFHDRVQKWKLSGLSLKKQSKTFLLTSNFETISDLQKHCRNSTNNYVYLSPRFPQALHNAM